MKKFIYGLLKQLINWKTHFIAMYGEVVQRCRHSEQFTSIGRFYGTLNLVYDLLTTTDLLKTANLVGTQPTMIS